MRNFEMSQRSCTCSFFSKKRKYLLSLRASFSNFAFFCILHSEEIQRVEIFRHSYQQDTASGSQPLSRSMTWLPASQPASGKKEVIFIAGAVATLLTHPGPAGAASACPHRRRCAAAAAAVRPSVVDLRGKSGDGARSCDRKIATNLRSTTTAAAASVSSDGRRTRSATGRRRLRQAVRHSVDRGRTSTGVSRESRCAARVDPVIEKF